LLAQGSGKTFAFLLPCVAAFFAPQFRATSEDLEMMGVQMDADNPEGIRAPSLVQGQIDEQRGCMPRAIILAPTRELASQIHVEARKLCHHSDMKAVVVYGGADIRTQLMELSTGCDIIVATPGRLNDLVDRGVVSFCQVGGKLDPARPVCSPLLLLIAYTVAYYSPMLPIL
jgi:superfamily II DNA/RNA helicase